MSEITEEFNKKVADFLKNAKPEEIVQILKDDKSMIVPMHVNHNNNKAEV